MAVTTAKTTAAKTTPAHAAPADFHSKFDKAYAGKSLEELLAAPVDAIKGVSEGDAEHLKAAFNIKTVKDLGSNKFFLWAHAAVTLGS